MSVSLTSSQARPGLQKPVCTIDFGGSSQIWQTNLVQVSITMAMAPFVDRVHIIAAQAGSAWVLGDSGTVAFGYDDGSPATVFTGAIESMRYNPDGTLAIVAADKGAELARLRLNQSYDQQKAGAIVSDLAAKAGAMTDTVQDGANFPFYVIDDTRSAWRHIGEMAAKSGFGAYFTATGGLYFGAVALGSPSASFTYGEDILDLQINQAAPLVQTMTVYGEGAAGSQGQDAWCWLVKDGASISAASGSGNPACQISDAALRNQTAIQNAADGFLNALTLSNTMGRIIVPGTPAVGPGSTIAMGNLPQNTLNGHALVHTVQHVFSKHAGFVTKIWFGM